MYGAWVGAEGLTLGFFAGRGGSSTCTSGSDGVGEGDGARIDWISGGGGGLEGSSSSDPVRESI